MKCRLGSFLGLTDVTGLGDPEIALAHTNLVLGGHAQVNRLREQRPLSLGVEV